MYVRVYGYLWGRAWHNFNAPDISQLLTNPFSLSFSHQKRHGHAVSWPDKEVVAGVES